MKINRSLSYTNEISNDEEQILLDDEVLDHSCYNLTSCCYLSNLFCVISYRKWVGIYLE
jgi:hypothetical protein